MPNLNERHPSVRDVAKHFDASHLPDELAAVSRLVGIVADEMLDVLPDSAELTVGLRKLLEAKDCFVRCAVANRTEVSA